MAPRRCARLLLAPLVAGVLVALTPPVATAGNAAGKVPPAEITVCRDTYGGGAVVTVPFSEYVKDVLPREYGSNGHPEYLKAGAIAIKSYAWRFVLHPYSSRCHITDGGRHQHYNPANTTNPRTDVTNAAVDQTWHVRIEENGAPALTQYCSRCGIFPAGRHLNQNRAHDQARSGSGYERILHAHYHAMSNLRLVDWRQGFGLAFARPAPLAIEDDGPFAVDVRVAGVTPGDGRATVTLHVACTTDAGRGVHVVQQVGVGQDADGRPLARFDRADAVRSCAEDEVNLIAVLRVNGYKLLHAGASAWRPWVSAEPREVERVAATDDAVTAAIGISRLLFPDAGSSEGRASTSSLAGALVADQAPEAARAVVLARADAFADALAATGLAGSDAPILLTPGGADAALDARVRAEIDRILEDGDTVHLVGGPKALSTAVERELAEAGYAVSRHAGETRVETALAVAEAIRAGDGDTTTVLVARAWPDDSSGWADAVTAGAYAATQRHPVLLTRPAALHPAVAGWIEASRNGVEEVVLLGGPAALSHEAEAAVRAPAVTRVWGPARDDTAVAIAETLWARPEAPEVQAALLVDVYGENDWPFALAASVYAANVGAPQLAVTRLVRRSSTGAWLDGHNGLPAVVVGGPAVVHERIDEDAAGDG